MRLGSRLWGSDVHSPGLTPRWSLQTDLYLLLPLPRLGPGVGTQAVHSSARHQVEEALVIPLLGSPRGNSGGLTHSFHLKHIYSPATLQSCLKETHLAQIYRSLAVEVFPGLVIPQLVFDCVKDKPSWLPCLQKSASLVKVTLSM